MVPHGVCAVARVTGGVVRSRRVARSSYLAGMGARSPASTNSATPFRMPRHVSSRGPSRSRRPPFLGDRCAQGLRPKALEENESQPEVLVLPALDRDRRVSDVAQREHVPRSDGRAGTVLFESDIRAQSLGFSRVDAQLGTSYSSRRTTIRTRRRLALAMARNSKRRRRSRSLRAARLTTRRPVHLVPSHRLR